MRPELGGTEHAGFEVEPSEIVGDAFTIRVSGHYVAVGDRVAPEWIDLELTGDASGPTTTARVEVHEGVPRVVAVGFVSRPGEGEVRQAHLREAQVEALLGLVAAFSLRIDDETNEIETGVDAGGDVGIESLAAIRNSRAKRRVTPEFLREVAEVYKANMAAPTRAVRERFFVGERMASKYVQQARAAGLLPPTSPGRKKA